MLKYVRNVSALWFFAPLDGDDCGGGGGGGSQGAGNLKRVTNLNFLKFSGTYHGEVSHHQA